jgi:hypothetical protein
MPLPPAVAAALEPLSGLEPAQVHHLQVGLAELVLSQAPPAALGQLELAKAFIEGRADAAALRDARQDCWSYVGSLACGCSVSDSASAHAIMTCLESDRSAHEPAALVEQVERVLRCGVSEPHIIAVLRGKKLA